MKKSQKQALAVGAGVAALAAAATAVYFTTGKHAKNRKKIAKWTTDMQKDVVKQLNKAGKVSKATYSQTIDAVAKNYQGIKNVSLRELALAVADLKSHWDAISDEMSEARKTVKSITPKTVKSVKKRVAAKKSRR